MKQYSIIIILCFLCLTRCASASLPSDEVSIIRERVLELMLWPSKNNISVVAQAALTFTRTLNISCYWPDIDYDDLSNVDWQTAIHSYRITTMLQALIVNGSSVKNDSQIRTALHCALNVWLTSDLLKLKRLKKYLFVLPGGYIVEYWLEIT